jgi:hypothetical protein
VLAHFVDRADVEMVQWRWRREPHA